MHISIVISMANFPVTDYAGFHHLLRLTAADVVPFCGPEMSVRTLSIVHILFSFWSFYRSASLLGEIRKTHFLTSIMYIWPLFE